MSSEAELPRPLADADEALTGASAARDELLIDRLVEAWLRLARAGVAPPIAHYAAAHPDVSTELREYLMGAALLEGLGERVRDTAARTLGSESRRGEVIGDFHIRGVLGRGGMGVVYDALDTRLGRAVALKVLPDSRIGDRRARERFEREAQAAARLDHRCIVPVHGVGESDGQHWYAMQRIDGVGLDELVRALAEAPAAPETSPAVAALAEELARRYRTERLDALEASPESTSTAVSRVLHPPRHGNAARIARDVAEALAHAHAAGVLHRDVKPSNVMLDRVGRVWVADFGLCKVAEHGSVTAVGDVVGTLRYMAPERLRGVESAQCDVYSLGLVLYELVTGQQAFPEVDRAELVRRIGLDEPMRAARLVPDLPRDLERILTKAIAKLPEERYANAEALARDLTAFLDGRPVSARPVGALYLARLFARRNRALVAVSACAAVVFAIATVVYVSGLVRLVRRVDQAHVALQVEANRARLAAATSALGAARLRLARGFLDEIPAEDRDWSTAHLQHRASAAGVVFGGGMGEVKDLVLLNLPDTRGGAVAAVAVLRADQLSVHALDDGRELASLGQRGIGSLTATDDGGALLWLSTDGGVVERWSCATGSPPAVLGELGAGLVGLAISAGRVAVLERSGLLRVRAWTDERWSLCVQLPEHAARATRAALGFADGTLVVALDGAGVFELDLATAALREVPLLAARSGSGGARSETAAIPRTEVSARLALAPQRAVVFVRPNRIAVLVPGSGAPAEVHPVDMRLTAFGVDAGTGRVHLANLAGVLSEWVPSRGRSDALGQVHSAAVTALLLVDGGRLFVTGSDGGEVRIGEVRAVLDRQLGIDACRVHVPAVTALAASRDGETLVSGDAAGGLAMWDLARVEPYAASAAFGPRVLELALALDGEVVLVAGAVTRLWRPKVAAGANGGTTAPAAEELALGATLAVRAIPDGFLAVTADGAVVRLGLDGGERERAAPPPERTRWTAATIGAGAVALGGEAGALWLGQLDGAGARVVWQALAPRASAARALAFSADGSALAAVDGAGELAHFSLAPGPSALGARAPEYAVVAAERGERRNGLSGVAFGRAGRWLLTASESGALLTWWRASGAAGAPLVQTWPPLTALSVPASGPPVVIGDGHGRVSVLQVGPAAPALGAARPALPLEDGALLLAELEGALGRSDAGMDWVRPAATELVQGLRRRQRFGTIELGAGGGARLGALAEAFAVPAAEEASE